MRKMIKIKLEKNKKSEPVFKLKVNEKNVEKYKFIRRALIEGKELKGSYNYEIPVRYFEPIFKNINSDEISLDKRSIIQYLEFSDEYEENYYYRTEADARYMKKWREEGCPNIYKVTIDYENCSINKEVAFKKLEPRLSIANLY